MVLCELEEVVISLYEDVASVVAFAGCEFGEEEAGGVGEYIYIHRPYARWYPLKVIPWNRPFLPFVVA